MKKLLFAFFLVLFVLVSAAFGRGQISDGVYYTFLDRQLSLVENYKDLKRDGLLVGFFDQGGVERLFQYREHRLDGTVVRYYPNQQIWYRAQFTNGILNGMTQHFYTNGRLAAERQYRQGSLNGIARFYREDGTLDHVALYYQGKLIRDQRCDPAGNVIVE